MNAVMASSPTWARPSFNISGTPGDNWTGRALLAGAGAAASALAGAELESCAHKTGATWLHKAMTATVIINLLGITLFIAIRSGPSTAATTIGGQSSRPAGVFPVDYIRPPAVGLFCEQGFYP
jgi:hypothetical protein